MIEPENSQENNQVAGIDDPQSAIRNPQSYELPVQRKNSSLGCLVFGYWWFQRTKKAFADIL